MKRRSWGFTNFLLLVAFPTVITEENTPRVRLVTGGRLLGIVVLLAFGLMPAAYAISAGQVSTSIVNGIVTIQAGGGTDLHTGHSRVHVSPREATSCISGS